jgi:hypothetical protein
VFRVEVCSSHTSRLAIAHDSGELRADRSKALDEKVVRGV